MEIVFCKVSDDRHVVRVRRDDGTSDSVELDSRSFLRHDLAHYAVESELGLSEGIWGSVARGGSLAGPGLDGDDMALAELISGPAQTMMRTKADAVDIEQVLSHVAPWLSTPELAQRLHERLRALAGHWAATPYGADMVLQWPSHTNLGD
jgi:hypothetical protein